jgi:glycerate kinase
VEVLERALARLVERLPSNRLGAQRTASVTSVAEMPGAGAAGGLGFAALLVGAQVRSGADYFLDLVGFDDVMTGADLVVTGEGSLDSQSLHGKAPFVVAARAARAGVRAIAVVGRSTLPPARWGDAHLQAVHALADLDPACADDPQLSVHLLEGVGRELARVAR